MVSKRAWWPQLVSPEAETERFADRMAIIRLGWIRLDLNLVEAGGTTIRV
jgi:hypothetical protein